MVNRDLQKKQAEAFSAMHREKHMFVIPNAWDTASAYIYAKTGFSAVATSSAGIAYALGYPDGEKITFQDLLSAVEKMTDRVHIPVSVDFERGYAEDSETVKENAKKLLEAGAVGFNIEDGFPDGTLGSLELQLEKLKALVQLKSETGISFVINARTDLYWYGIGTGEERFKAAVERGNAFAEVGADCVFIPGAICRETVSELVRNIGAPLNIILNGTFHDFKELDAAGVRRLSVGSGPVRYVLGRAIEMAQNLKDGNTDDLLGTSFTYGKANEYFSL